MLAALIFKIFCNRCFPIIFVIIFIFKNHFPIFYFSWTRCNQPLIGCKNILGLKLHYTFLVPATEWILTENDRRGMDDQDDNNRLSKINHSSLFRQLENKLQPARYQRKHFLRQRGENCWNQVYDEGKFTLLCLLIATTLLWLCFASVYVQ